jgi:hypothetical protein
MSRRTDNPKQSKSSRINPVLYIIIVFILSRLFYFYLGIRFDATPLNNGYQYIDPDLLRNNLFQSLYYLHSQPPLFNLFLGSILKLFSGNQALAFNLIYLSFGLILSVSIFLIMTRLGLSSKLSAILTTLFMVSPACILYENWLFYTYPIATFLCLAALFLHRFLKKKNLRDGIIFFTLLSLVVLTISFFHILWFIIFVVILLCYQRDKWKKIVFAFFLPFLVCLLLYLKNAYIFGSFSSSSWFGMNFVRMTIYTLPMKDRVSLVNQGKISKLSLILPFASLKEYQTNANWTPRAQKTNIPVLDQEVKSTGAINLNNVAYIDISKQYLNDAIYVLKSHPEAYLLGLLGSFYIYSLPSSDYSFLEGNRKHIQLLDRFYNIVFCGQLDRNRKNVLSMGLFLIIGYFIAIIYGLRLTLKALSRKHRDLPFALTVLFLWINIVYVTLVGNSIEIGENNRFRFMIDPFFLIILGLFIQRRFKKSKPHFT